MWKVTPLWIAVRGAAVSPALGRGACNLIIESLEGTTASGTEIALSGSGPKNDVQVPRLPPCEQLVDRFEHAVPCAFRFDRVDGATRIVLSCSDGLVIEGNVF